jgi:hypothetical protein
LVTWPSRSFTTMASMNSTGYTGSSGRFDLHLAGRQTLRAQRDHDPVHSIETVLSLADQLRREGAVTPGLT